MSAIKISQQRNPIGRKRGGKRRPEIGTQTYTCSVHSIQIQLTWNTSVPIQKDQVKSESKLKELGAALKKF